ncbi:MAG: ABC transporter substrate-binding protein [Chloroflexi bacterium]|nr:ABC transporter substrate-binding protein [Chloroflexota bacterium]
MRAFRLSRVILAMTASVVLFAQACTTTPATTPGPTGGGQATPVATEAPTTKPVVTVRALLPFVRGPAFFAQMIAEQNGYFAEEGIDIRWEPSEGSSFAVQQVIAGNADVAITITDNAMLGFAQSPTFKNTYNMNGEATGHLNDTWALKSSGFDSMDDLRGSDIGVKDLAGGEVPGLRVALQKVGLTEGTDYNIVPLGEDPAVQAEALSSGKVGAFRVTFLSLVAVKEAVASQGDELVCISCDESELISSLIIIASNDLIENQPEVVAGLGRAIAKGTLFGLTNPEATVQIVMAAAPEQTDADLVAAQLAATLAQHEPGPPPADRNNFGYINAEGLQNTMDVLLSPGNPSGLEAPIDLNAFHTNDFVDEYNDYDQAAIIAAAEDWTP